jgi:hypothetical protein
MLRMAEYVETSEQLTHCRCVTFRKKRNRQVYRCQNLRTHTDRTQHNSERQVYRGNVTDNIQNNALEWDIVNYIATQKRGLHNLSIVTVRK